jgi:hypothetical protein
VIKKIEVDQLTPRVRGSAWRDQWQSKDPSPMNSRRRLRQQPLQDDGNGGNGGVNGGGGDGGGSGSSGGEVNQSFVMM